MKKMWLLLVIIGVIVACNDVEEINLCVNKDANGDEFVFVADSLFCLNDSTNIVSPLGFGDDIDDWYQIYTGPYNGVASLSHTIVSPAPGLGSVTITYKVSYLYCTRLMPPYDNALVEVGDVYDFKMVRNTPLYLLMQNPNGVAGPINITPSVNAPQRTISCNAFITIVGDGGFFRGADAQTNEFIQFIDYVHI